MVKVEDYAGGPTAWCPGCGNFGILTALKKALVGLELEPYQILVVSGIGQAGKMPHYMKCNTLNVLHGRTLPAAAGAKMANRELTMIAVGGDGDGYGEGGNHFLHALRRNHDITYLVHNNQVYALTKGQASPTSDAGFVTKTTPHGSSDPLNALAVAIAAGGTFVARGFAGQVDHLAGLIQEGIQHRGFALIEVLQPCVSFNRRNTFAWYKQRAYRLEESGYQPQSKEEAIHKAFEWGEKIPIGVFWKEEKATFEDQIQALREGTLASQEINPGRIEKLLDALD